MDVVNAAIRVAGVREVCWWRDEVGRARASAANGFVLDILTVVAADEEDRGAARRSPSR